MAANRRRRRGIIKSHFRYVIMNCHKKMLLLFIGFCSQMQSQPNLSSQETIKGVAVYGDLKKSDIFYFVPQGIELDADTNGKPNFTFAKMTHIASRAAGRENWKKTSMIQFKIRKSGINRNMLKEIKSVLKKRINPQAKLTLVPIPIHRIQANLVYTNLDTDSTQVLKNNYYNTEKSKKGGIWSTKTFTLRPDKFTSQSLWDAFKNDKGLLSIAYAIWTKGKHTDSISYRYTGPKELESIFQNLNKESKDSTQLNTEEALISAGAIQVNVDLKKWPDLLKEIGFGSTLSPRYGLVDVYCYDFSDNIRPDLIGKIVEFKAHGAGNGFVNAEVSFKKSNPDIVAHALKFEYAVRLDMPLKYRIIELTETGEVNTGIWQEKESWSSIIEVSSKKDFETTIKSDEK